MSWRMDSLPAPPLRGVIRPPSRPRNHNIAPFPTGGGHIRRLSISASKPLGRRPRASTRPSGPTCRAAGTPSGGPFLSGRPRDDMSRRAVPRGSSRFAVCRVLAVACAMLENQTLSGRRALRAHDRRAVRDGRDAGSAGRRRALRSRADFARDGRRPAEPSRHGDPIGPGRLRGRGAGTCRRQLARRPVQRHVRELAPPTAPADRDPRPAARRSGVRTPHRPRPHRGGRTFRRRLRRARPDRRQGGYAPSRAALHAKSRRRPWLLRLWPVRTAVPGPLPDLSDRRVRAVAAVAPVGALFGDGAFAGVEAPAQIHRLGWETGRIR